MKSNSKTKKEIKSTKPSVKRNRGEKNVKWTVTFCVYGDGNLYSFGNLSSRIYDTEDEAWDELVQDFEYQKVLRGVGKGINTYINRNNNRASVDDVVHNSGVIWELQKMKCNNSKKTLKKA